MNWEYEINRCTLPIQRFYQYKDFLYSAGNYVQYLVINYNRKIEKKVQIYIYTYITSEINTIL